MKIRKYIPWIAGCMTLLLLILFLTVWGLSTKTANEEEEKAVVLTVMLPQTHNKNFFLELIEQFENEHSNIRIELQVIPDNQWIDVVKKKVLVRETPDIIRIDRELLENIGVENFCEMTPEESWYDRVIPIQRESKEVNGKLYGLPIISGESFFVVYNREIFKKYDLKIPRNVEQFEAVCEILKENGEVPLYVSDKDSWTTQTAFNAIAPQVTGEEVWEELRTGQISWSEVPEFAEIFQTMKELREKGYTNENYRDATYTGAVNAMAHGEAAMYIVGNYFIQDVLELNPEADLMVFPVPYEKDVLTMFEGQGQLSVFQDSRHQKEAELFLEWFSQADHMDVFTKGWGCLPVFSDQQQELSEIQQFLQEEYVVPKRTVSSVQDRFSGIDWSDFWTYQQLMCIGDMSPGEALQAWDIVFERQITEGP